MDGADEKKTELFAGYYEKKIGKTLYRVKSVYRGEIELGKALEDLTVSRILREIGSVRCE